MKKFLSLFLIISTVFCFSSVSMCFAENVEADSKNVQKVEVVSESKKSKFSLETLKKLKEKYNNSKTLQAVTFVVSGLAYVVAASYFNYQLIKASVISGLEEYNEKNSVVSNVKEKVLAVYDFVKSSVNDSLSYLDFIKIF